MSLDNSLWMVGILGAAVVVGLLAYRRTWRALPIFFVYSIWDFLSNVATFAVAMFAAGRILKIDINSSSYLSAYLYQTIIDSVLQFCVLVELVWSVLRPVRSALPRFSLVFIVIITLGVGLAVWQIPAPVEVTHASGQHFLMHLVQSVSVLRILFFLGMAACSQLLSIGWRDRELQVATGMGVYSLCSVGVAILQARETNALQYSHLNQVVIAGYLCCLLYWVFSFAQKEPERREFTPQMQNLLLAVAGVARADRAALADARKKHEG